jgi:hypothetical protein
MNVMYEIEYHAHQYPYGLDNEVVTVDGRSARHNRTPVCMIEHAREQAKLRGCWRFRIAQVKVKHITASKVEGMVAHLIYEEWVEKQEVVVS